MPEFLQKPTNQFGWNDGNEEYIHDFGCLFRKNEKLTRYLPNSTGETPCKAVRGSN